MNGGHSEKNNFTKCTLPSEIIELVDDEVQDLRVPRQHAPPDRLYQTPSVNQMNPGFTPHLMPKPTEQQTLRINRPDLSSLNPIGVPQMGLYQPEPLPGRTNQSGFDPSDMYGTDFSDVTMSYTGSSSFGDILGVGYSRSETGVSNLMLTPQTGHYRAVQQDIANGSNINLSTYSMPLHTGWLDHTSIPLDSDFSSFNFGMLPQPSSLVTRPDIGYPSVTTSSQINSFQLKEPQYSRTRHDMGFPSSVISHPTGSLHGEHPNGSTNVTNPVHIESQRSSTTESGTGTIFLNSVSTQPQVNSYENSAFLTTLHKESSSTQNIPPQGSEPEGRPFQEMVPTEEVATNQVTTENQGIDLNKTPQQKPRRRKYVPKVVRQGKKPPATKKTTPKKAIEDRPKRKYVKKKCVEEPLPVETPVDAIEAGRPVGNSNKFTQEVADLPSNPIASSPSLTSIAANCLNKTDDLPTSSTLNAEIVQDKPVEPPHSCTPNAVNDHNKLAEVSTPCTTNVMTGHNKPIDISSSGSNMAMQIPEHHTVGGMSGPCKSVRRRLNFDAEEVRPDEYKHAQSQPNLNSVSVPPARRNVSTLPNATTSVQASKGIALDLNSTASQWQEEFDRLFPSMPSTSICGTNQALGTNQTPWRNMSTNPAPTGLCSFTGYPYPPLPHHTNSSVGMPTTPVNHSQMGLYKEKLAAHAKKNNDLISERLVKANNALPNSYSSAPSLILDGRKRDYNVLVNNTGLTGQVRAELSPRIIETSKKTRIRNGNNTGQNGMRNNVSVLYNPSSALPPIRPDGRAFSLADAQRLVELQKRNNTHMFSFRIPEGNPPACATNAAITTSTPVKLAQAVNATSRDQIYQPGASIQTSCERSAMLNQCVNSSGTPPCRQTTPVISGVNSVTLEMLIGSGNMNATSTQPVDHMIRPHAANDIVRSESCQIGANTIQTGSERTTEKTLVDICPPPSTPAKSSRVNGPSKSEPKRRGRPPKKENAGADPLVSPRPKRRPRGKKSSPSSTNLMVGCPVTLACTLELIIQKMTGLNINRISETVQGLPCYALVPYQTGVSDGRIMLYDEGMVKKKRKSRAQVDLDPVTSQVWNLLMGKEMKDGLETVNENDEKMMEAEREVFRGRVDSFIARMHLVQGDRRFSPWKGSVVDSVVGVFLTQNVSDHLSSSAFMALVAKYPVKTQLQNSQPRESMLIVSRPCNTNTYSRDFINLTKWHRQREVIIEDFTDIGSQVTSVEKDSNESQGSTTKCPGSSPEKKLMGSPDSGPDLVMNFSGDDPTSESVFSSQNSVVSNQNSPDYLSQTGEQNLTGLGLCGNHCTDGPVGNTSLCALDFVCAHPTSYTQLLRMAESNGVDFSQDFNKGPGAMVDDCSYSNISQYYPQKGNIYSGTSSTLNNSNMSCMYPQNGVYPPPAAPATVNGNTTSETFQTPNSELRIRTHSPVVSRTPESITPMIKITTSSGKPNGYIPVQEEKKMCQVESNQELLQQPQPQAQSTLSASNLHNTPNGNDNKNLKASSETVQKKQPNMIQKAMDGTVIDDVVNSKGRKGKGASGKGKKNFDWDSLRRAVLPDGVKKERTYKTMDSLDYEALRNASVKELADAIRERGMNNMLAERIKAFMDRVVNDHGSIDLEWLRDVDPDKAKDYLLSIRGLGLKSVECVRLLTLHHMAFPVDTNVGRICVRLGWVPLQPLPESLQLHLLEMYPILENIQKYLWPRLCKLDQRTLYELHYQMITFGKVFCTKSKPNCNACPMRAECKHFASAFASARLALPAPEEKGLTAAALLAGPSTSTNIHSPFRPRAPPPQIEGFSTLSSSLPVPFPYPTPVNLPYANQPQSLSQTWVSNPTVTPTQTQTQTCNEPIIEEPASPEPEPEVVAEKEIGAIEDAFLEEDPDEIPVIKLDVEEFTQNLKNYIQANNLEIEETNVSKAMVAISPEAASIPVPKLKNVSRLRTEHQVYELPDNHNLLQGFGPREPDDPCPYLLSIWTPGETAMSTEPPKSLCISQDVDELCDKAACARCASIKEARSKIVRGTILIPCRTAMRGSFPLNGTYFQVNEVFADHETSRTPVDISRTWIWNLPRRTVYFGTSIPTIFKGQTTEEIQHCFWRGFVCVRGFDRATRAPRPLYARLHFPASKLTRNGKKSAAAKDEA